MILGRYGYKDWYEPSSLSFDGWLGRSWWHLRLFATPSLSLVRPKVAQSIGPVLTNGRHAGVLAAVPSQPLMVMQRCVKLGFCGFWKHFWCPLWWKLLLPFVPRPTTSRPLPAICASTPHSDTRWCHRICLLMILGHCLIFRTKRNIARMNYRILQYSSL